MKKFSSRRVLILGSAVLIGASTFVYGLTTYRSAPYCYYGRTMTQTSIKSQADADTKAANMIAQSPGNYSGECVVGSTPTTPGAP